MNQRIKTIFADAQKLSPAERALVEHAADGLVRNKPDWQELDRTVHKIYGMGPLDAAADQLEHVRPSDAQAVGRLFNSE